MDISCRFRMVLADTGQPCGPSHFCTASSLDAEKVAAIMAAGLQRAVRLEAVSSSGCNMPSSALGGDYQSAYRSTTWQPTCGASPGTTVSVWY